MFQLPLDFGWTDLLDIGFVAVLFYAVIISMKRARAGLALGGVLILGAVYILASQFGLDLTAWILRGFATVFLILLVVIFQKDLRQMFERIAVWSLRRSPLRKPSEEGTEVLSGALAELSKRRHGALLVIPGRDPIERHLGGGEPLDGKLSRALLLSLFDPSSIGHDGAVVIQGDRVSHFSVQLPLSTNFPHLGSRGTRHSAALGLSERTDAVCVVLSEETGELSIAHEGVLDPLESPAELREALDKEMRKAPHRGEKGTGMFAALAKNWLTKLSAVSLAVATWLVFVSGSQVAQRTLQVPVVVDNIHPDFDLENIEPNQVAVTVSGLRRDLYLLDPANVELRLDAFLVGFGRRMFEISSANVSHPTDLTVLDVAPRKVKLSVARAQPAQKGDPSSKPSGPPRPPAAGAP